MWAKIITIKRTKDLNYFSLCVFNLFNTRVSQFELNYWNKWTFPRNSNLLRCTCRLYIYIYIYIYILHTLHHPAWWFDWLLCSYNIIGSFMYVRDAAGSRLEQIEEHSLSLSVCVCVRERERACVRKKVKERHLIQVNTWKPTGSCSDNSSFRAVRVMERYITQTPVWFNTFIDYILYQLYVNTQLLTCYSCYYQQVCKQTSI